MAQKIILIDDVDGSEATETITYTVDGLEYEIDLSEENVQKFRAALEPYIQKSREVERQVVFTPTPARTTTRRRSTSGSGREDIAEIRAWAQAQGLEVNPRGRIKKEIVERYDAEHSKSKPALATIARTPATTTPLSEQPN